MRTIAKGKKQEVAGYPFVGYGSHCNDYPHHYLTAAAAIGSTKADIEIFIQKLKSVYVELQSKAK